MQKAALFFRASEENARKIKEIANKTNKSVSTILREAVELYISLYNTGRLKVEREPTFKLDGVDITNASTERLKES